MTNLTPEQRDFISYIEDTLVPDLRDSGHDATADDFMSLVAIIDHLTN